MFQHLSVNPAQFAATKQVLQESKPVGNFERLESETLNPEALLHYRIEGGKDKMGRIRLTLKLSGKLNVACQRCLGTIEHEIDADKIFYPADTPERLEQLERELAYEADSEVEVIEAGNTLDLATLIEDEVLLGLPAIPMHPEGACQLPEDTV